MKPSHSTIGERLRWAREQAGLSQGQVAKVLAMHRPTISQMEADQRKLKAEEVQKIADLYEVDQRWLVGGAIDEAKEAKIQLAARQLAKLNPDDLDRILSLLKVLREPGDSPRE